MHGTRDGTAASGAGGQQEHKLASECPAQVCVLTVLFHHLPPSFSLQQNVKLTRDALYFYHGAGFQRPKDVWVDFVSGNLTHPQLPNMIVIKGEVKQKLW